MSAPEPRRGAGVGVGLAVLALAGCVAGEATRATGPRPNRGPGAGAEPTTPGDPGANSPVPPLGPAMGPTGSTAGPGGGAGAAPGVQPPGSTVRCKDEVLARRVLRRMTAPELEATVRAAFGLDAAQWTGPSFLPDPASGDGFTNNGERLVVGDAYADRLLEAAKDVASKITDAATLPRISACSARGDEACAGSFIDSYGPRLFRRPLTAAERARYLALFAKARGSAPAPGGFKDFVYWATVALISSPNTIYRSELGEPAAGGRFRLTPYETASALSFAYLGEPPPPELLELAQGRRLETADQVEAAARALVLGADGRVRPAFRASFLRFAEQWLGLTALENLKKDSASFPDFSTEVQASLAEEARQFLDGVLLAGRGKPADLFTAPYTFIDGPLWAYYRIGAPVVGRSFVRTERPAGWGLGLTGQGALLAIAAGNVSTSPTKRGHLVRERLLCQTVPPPPPVVSELPEPTPAETTRQRYEQIHLADPACKGCHLLMDPIGFGLEHLDASGRYRAREGRFDIDDRGVILGTSRGELAFEGAEQLARRLGELTEAADCIADFVTGYAFGLDHRQAGCIARTATEELRDGKIGVLDFYIRLARADSFRLRGP